MLPVNSIPLQKWFLKQFFIFIWRKYNCDIETLYIIVMLFFVYNLAFPSSTLFQPPIYFSLLHAILLNLLLPPPLFFPFWQENGSLPWSNGGIWYNRSSNCYCYEMPNCSCALIRNSVNIDCFILNVESYSTSYRVKLTYESSCENMYNAIMLEIYFIMFPFHF